MIHKDAHLYLIGTVINNELNLNLLDEFLTKGYVAIYWKGIGDASQYHEKIEIRKALRSVDKYKNESERTLINYARSIYQFVHDIRSGIDLVACADTKNRALHIGIPGHYQYLPHLENKFRSHQRPVNWFDDKKLHLDDLPDPLARLYRNRPPMAVWRVGRYADLGLE